MKQQHILMFIQLFDAFPSEYFRLSQRMHVMHNLISDLHAISGRDGIVSAMATQLAFTFATGAEWPIGNRGPERCCELLMHLCRSGLESYQAIAPAYFALVGIPLSENFDWEWVETAALENYYMAAWSLGRFQPEMYSQWGSSLIASAKEDGMDPSELLHVYLRLGHYSDAMSLLRDGVYPINDPGSPSAMHWLCSFENEADIRSLADTLIQSGAVVDEWIDKYATSEFVAGKSNGTPMHWAIIYRNLAAIKVLRDLDPTPDPRNATEAFGLAASLHFSDVLEELEGWILRGLMASNTNGAIHESTNPWSGVACAVLSGHSHLARLLRNGNSGFGSAAVKTLDICLRMVKLNDEQIMSCITTASISANPILFRHVLKTFRSTTQKKEHRALIDESFNSVVSRGQYQQFEVLLETGLFQRDTIFYKGQYSLTQVVCMLRQRDISFMQRVLQLGCDPDALGPEKKDEISPFTFAVIYGLYDVASLLVRSGANKDFVNGVLGGQTVAMRIFTAWPDMPVSRVQYLLEALPQEGLGHIRFEDACPGLGCNLLYAFAFCAWGPYRSSNRLAENVKFVVSKLADFKQLNQIDRMGTTALGIAARACNYVMCKALIERGADVNLGMARSPLNGALEILEQRIEREKKSRTCFTPREKELAQKLVVEAENCVRLLRANGAIDKGQVGSFGNIFNALSTGSIRLPDPQVS